MSAGARVGAIVVAAFIIGGIGYAAYRLMSQEYGVLFSGLKPEDAASIVAELKKEKVPFRLSEAGATISVPEDKVHEVRLDLMSGELPLSGGVGFEIFDKQGLGATEHSQKVAFQRALQGELARTIGALDHVKHVRVHLVMPESTLFTRDRQEASASVSLLMDNGTTPSPQQISGVQRLVAAAVPGLDPSRVVVSDHRGVTLSAPDVGGGASGAIGGRLEIKKEVEDYVAQKIARMLDGALGAGQAIVSVDASLNFDATKTTIRDLLPSADQSGEAGHVVRRRQVTGSSSSEPAWTSAVDGLSSPRTPGTSTEVEYEYGQRVDEIIAAPGAVTRLSVGVIVPSDLDEDLRARIAELVKVAAGINVARGDAISIQSLSQMHDAATEVTDEPAQVTSVVASRPGSAQRTAVPVWAWVCAALLGIFAIALIVKSRPVSRELTAEQRQQILDEIKRTLSEDAVSSRGRA